MVRCSKESDNGRSQRSLIHDQPKWNNRTGSRKNFNRSLLPPQWLARFFIFPFISLNGPSYCGIVANDPNVAVALAASQYLISDSFSSYRFSGPPVLEYTNIPTRLTGLCMTPEIIRTILSALVAVSSSTAPTGNESLACALRLDPDHPTRPAVELILSSHEPVRKGTVRHLKKIWNQMLAISAVPNKRSGEHDTFVRLLTTFRHMVYTHTMSKLRGDFAVNMEAINHWKASIFTDNGGLLVESDDVRLRELVVETLFYLERCRSAFARMKENDQDPKRLISTRADFLALVAAMELGSQAADKLLMNTLSLQMLSMRCFGSKHVLRDAFQSITALPRHIVELLHFAANHMESLHTHALILTLVSPVTAVPHDPWPEAKQTWESIQEYILKENDCIASQIRHHDDLADVLPNNLVVHGELILITYLHALHFHTFKTTVPVSSLSSLYRLKPPPFNYIAVSPPPCAPSALWIDAYNARHAYRGDGLRFDIALDPFVHWNSSRNCGWRWVPLPALPTDFVDSAEAGTKAGAAPTSIQAMRKFGYGIRKAEERIVAAAWEAYTLMIGEKPQAVTVKPIEMGRRNSAPDSQKVRKGLLLRTR